MQKTLDEQDLEDRLRRAEEWKTFRKNNLITQKKLADLIEVSRRTIQQIEAGIVSPHAATLSQFNTLQQKYKANGK